MMNLRLLFLFAIIWASCQNQPAADVQTEAPATSSNPETAPAEQKAVPSDISQKAEAASQAGGQIANVSGMVGISKGTIIGKNVPVRKEAGFKAEKVGNFNDNEVVSVIGNQVIQTEGQGVLKKPVVLKKNDSSITIGKEKNVMVEGFNPSTNTFSISYEDPKKGRHEAEVNADAFLGRIFANWYQVRRENGETGWVMDLFLKH
ncbi:MAG: hypothetical protein IT261_06270 [Saprospiraceae bacterium]|nr:hypothetical protein [Saprospiraceae bacterium]